MRSSMTAQPVSSSDTLVDFLAAGDPPVFIGFGNNIDDEPRSTTRVVVEALRRAGRRGVLLRPPAAIDPTVLGDDMLVVSPVPFSWLFPRCAAAVAPCGRWDEWGCAPRRRARGARPHHSDQFVWAKRAHQLGVTSAPIPRRKLSIERLAEAIRTATLDGAARRRVAELGDAIRAEDGVQRPVEQFERCVDVQAPRRVSTTPAVSPGSRR